MMVRQTIAGALLILLAVAASGTAVAQTPNLDFKGRPVFFEMFYDSYADEEQIEFLRSDQVRLKPLGTESIANFDWVRHERTDESWWQRVENLVYLLPMIASEEASDRDWLEAYFTKWYEVHALKQQPNIGAWDPMTAAFRTLVMTYWLKVEEARGGSESLTRNLRRMLERHQRFLQKPENYDDASNHGLWEAIALFESTRMFPNVELTQLALDRYISLVKLAVSEAGIQKEHSPRYHFFFLEWVSQHAAYLASLQLDWGQGVRDLKNIEKNMRRAAYFLADHRDNIPQIGDTDAEVLSDAYRSLVEVQEGDVLYDPEGAFAIFKDPQGRPHKRYVVFCNQNDEYMPYFRYHFHNDMMSVYYADDGEVILGDAGRYSYSRSDVRAYLMSMAAHNTIVPESMLVPRTPGIFVANEVWQYDEPDSVTFGAALIDDVVRREVTVSRADASIVVRDALNNPDVFIMLWHLGHDVEEYKAGKVVKYAQWRTYEWELTTKRGRRFALRIRVDGRNGMSREEVSIVAGEENPYLAWYSPGYNRIEPTPTIKLMLNPRSAEEPLEVTTEIFPVER